MPVSVRAEAMLSDADLVGLLRTMLLIRRFAELALALRLDDRIFGVVHPYIGQEAIAAGALSVLNDGDFVVSNHRGHGHCIARGASTERMMAELFGRATGFCRGKGGSMHIADFSRGIVGANGIVGAGLPIGAGVALAIQLLERQDVVLIFFGDGAAGQGVFHETMNYASLAKLPVVLLCENNNFAVENAVEDTLVSRDVAAFALPYAVPGAVVDGTDVLAVRAAVARAVDRARAGDGPSLLECKTHRWGVHSQRRAPVPERRGIEYLSRARAHDPIALFAATLEELGLLSAGDLESLERDVHAELAHAVDYAEASPSPAASEAYADVYADV
jgi:acetoin:2,6-dichlorophenolindophenol oxidoreductase subunit alpha